jgi:alpha-L-arabinofuranosidase
VGKPLEARIQVHGANVQSGTATVLTSSDIHARNTFDEPQALAPKAGNVSVRSAGVTYQFPPASVVKLELTLA